MSIKVAKPLRFKLAWGNYVVGDLIGTQADNPVPATTRDFLIANGFAEPVEVVTAKALPVPTVPAAETPISTPPRRRGVR